jgi:phage shock protein PspC (stress-responsive transcriptional regulator)
MSTRTRFYRSRSEAMVAGVCSGIARALALEVWVVRLIFLLLVIGFGTGVLAYLVLWFIMPEERPGSVIEPYVFEQTAVNQRRVTVASILMLIGAYMLINVLFGPQVWRYAVPALLIIGGIILFSSKK